MKTLPSLLLLASLSLSALLSISASAASPLEATGGLSPSPAAKDTLAPPIQEWLFSYEGHYGSATAMTMDTSGNVYVAGYIDLQDFYNSRMTTLKVSPEGEMLWIRIDDANGIPGFHEGWAIALDEARSAVYVAGDIADGIFLTVKYDLDGNELWSRSFDPGLAGIPSYMAVDPAGNVYVAGDTYGDGSTNQDITVLKYSPEGALLWEAVYD